jgi:Cu-Zn family superoxide dismutase
LQGVSVGGANDVVGRGVVLHANPDDYRSQPAGNSGPRIACGVIAKR